MHLHTQQTTHIIIIIISHWLAEIGLGMGMGIGIGIFGDCTWQRQPQMETDTDSETQLCNLQFYGCDDAACETAELRLSGIGCDWVSQAVGQPPGHPWTVVGERAAWLIWRIAVMRHIWKSASETHKKTDIKTKDLGNELVCHRRDVYTRNPFKLELKGNVRPVPGKINLKLV